MKYFLLVSFFLLSFKSGGQSLNQIRGWNILSDSYDDAIVTISAAKAYNINHFQLSHNIVMDLNEVKMADKQSLVNDLTSRVHNAGIKEVVIWDHALYDLKYYPDQFKTGSEKLAAVVDAVADVVCNELGKQLYIRTFAYTDAEYENTIGCISHIKNRKIILMMKETPHDFFLTHPNDKYAGTIDRPTIMEFDAGNEFNGQGVIANTWPGYIIKRWSDLIKRPNVIGYIARTDRYGDTRIIGTPNEILLFTLKRYTEDQRITADGIYNEFITQKYGEKAIPFLKPAFEMAFDIISSSLYTLGTNVANHSKMDYDPYKSSYGRHVSGKWLDVKNSSRN